MDFCSGGGHLGILLAHLLPNAVVSLVENKDESLRRAMQRVEKLGKQKTKPKEMKNVSNSSLSFILYFFITV